MKTLLSISNHQKYYAALPSKEKQLAKPLASLAFDASQPHASDISKKTTLVLRDLAWPNLQGESLALCGTRTVPHCFCFATLNCITCTPCAPQCVSNPHV